MSPCSQWAQGAYYRYRFFKIGSNKLLLNKYNNIIVCCDGLKDVSLNSYYLIRQHGKDEDYTTNTHSWITYIHLGKSKGERRTSCHCYN